MSDFRLSKLDKKATGEPDQDYDHEFFDKLVEQLAAAGVKGAIHKEFDKYQGVYLKVPGVDTFWMKDVFYAGTGEDEHRTAFVVFSPESNQEVNIDVQEHEIDKSVDAEELVGYCKQILEGNKSASLKKTSDEWDSFYDWYSKKNNITLDQSYEQISSMSSDDVKKHFDSYHQSIGPAPVPHTPTKAASETRYVCEECGNDFKAPVKKTEPAEYQGGKSWSFDVSPCCSGDYHDVKEEQMKASASETDSEYAEYAAKERLTPHPGYYIKFNLNRVKQYNRAILTPEEDHGVIDDIASNGYTVKVPGGEKIFVNSVDVLDIAASLKKKAVDINEIKVGDIIEFDGGRDQIPDEIWDKIFEYDPEDADYKEVTFVCKVVNVALDDEAVDVTIIEPSEVKGKELQVPDFAINNVTTPTRNRRADKQVLCPKCQKILTHENDLHEKCPGDTNPNGNHSISIMDMKYLKKADLDKCPCGSGEQPVMETDAKGIPLGYTCSKCKEDKLSDFRKDVLSDPNYEADEPIEASLKKDSRWSIKKVGPEAFQVLHDGKYVDEYLFREDAQKYINDKEKERKQDLGLDASLKAKADPNPSPETIQPAPSLADEAVEMLDALIDIQKVKAELRKKAGSWALPFSEGQALKLAEYLNKLSQGELPNRQDIYNCLGVDALWDSLDKLDSTTAQKYVKTIKDFVKKMISDYKARPESYSKAFEPAALEILEEISNMGVSSSLKKVAEELRCPICSDPFQFRKSLTSHVTIAHHYTLDEANELVDSMLENFSSLKLKAAEPKENPVEYKELKIRPKDVSEDEVRSAELPTDAILGAYKKLKTHQNNLAEIKRMVDSVKAKLNEEVRKIETEGKKVEDEAGMRQSVDDLAALISSAQSRVMSFGSKLVAFVEEEKEVPFKITDKEKLERILDKFPDVEKYLAKLEAAMKPLGTTEKVKKLIEWEVRDHAAKPAPAPKAELALSKLDKKAGLMDTLKSIYDAASDFFSSITGLTEELDAILPAQEATASKKEAGARMTKAFSGRFQIDIKFDSPEEAEEAYEKLLEVEAEFHFGAEHNADIISVILFAGSAEQANTKVEGLLQKTNVEAKTMASLKLKSEWIHCEDCNKQDSDFNMNYCRPCGKYVCGKDYDEKHKHAHGKRAASLKRNAASPYMTVLEDAEMMVEALEGTEEQDIDQIFYEKLLGVVPHDYLVVDSEGGSDPFDIWPAMRDKYGLAYENGGKLIFEQQDGELMLFEKKDDILGLTIYSLEAMTFAYMAPKELIKYFENEVKKKEKAPLAEEPYDKSELGIGASLGKKADEQMNLFPTETTKPKEQPQDEYKAPTRMIVLPTGTRIKAASPEANEFWSDHKEGGFTLVEIKGDSFLGKPDRKILIGGWGSDYPAGEKVVLEHDQHPGRVIGRGSVIGSISGADWDADKSKAVALMGDKSITYYVFK